MIKNKLVVVILLIVSSIEICNAQTPNMRIVTYDVLSKITYDVTRYGNQSWFRDDLKSFKLIGNITIPKISDVKQSDTINYPAYFITDNKFYYNWYTVENQKICPNQWRVPDLADFMRLVYIVNEDSSGFARLKSSGNYPKIYWTADKLTATHSISIELSFEDNRLSFRIDSMTPKTRFLSIKCIGR